MPISLPGALQAIPTDWAQVWPNAIKLRKLSFFNSTGGPILLYLKDGNDVKLFDAFEVPKNCFLGIDVGCIQNGNALQVLGGVWWKASAVGLAGALIS